MTYIEFKNKYLGKGIDWDGKYGFQCVDVYRRYCNEVLNIPQSPPVAGAKDIWNTYLKEHFDRIPNSPTGVPQQGDIVIWGMAPYGHIAICDKATTSTLTCFEQNWKEMNGSGVTELRLHGNYNNVLGWLHFKNVIIEDMTDEQKRILEFLNGKTEGDVRAAFGALNDMPSKDKQIQTLQAKVLDLEKNLNDLSDRITALESNIQADLKSIGEWQSKVETANKSLENANKTNMELVKEKNQYKNWYESKLDEIKKLDKMTAWQHIKYGINLLIKKSK